MSNDESNVVDFLKKLESKRELDSETMLNGLDLLEKRFESLVEENKKIANFSDFIQGEFKDLRSPITNLAKHKRAIANLRTSIERDPQNYKAIEALTLNLPGFDQTSKKTVELIDALKISVEHYELLYRKLNEENSSLVKLSKTLLGLVSKGTELEVLESKAILNERK